MTEMKRWRITAYDENLAVRAADSWIGSHANAVSFAEALIGHRPQWSYQIVEQQDAQSVLDEVAAERRRQDAKWGEQNHPDGTGPETQPLFAATATGIGDDDEASLIRDMMRGRTDWRFHEQDRDRDGTWADILLEEVFEALAESEESNLRTELIQVAAVATQWVEAIDRRATEEAQA